jgi:hypothetical protein
MDRRPQQGRSNDVSSEKEADRMPTAPQRFDHSAHGAFRQEMFVARQ